MGRFMVYPYKQNSEGAIAIAEAVGGQRIRRENSQYVQRDDDLIINWGCGDNPYPDALNAYVNICINKKSFFERMQGHNIVPPFAFAKAEAIRHLSFPILCRTTVEGADGAGIVIANNADEMQSARLYTQLIEKTAEYRIHLGRQLWGSIVLIAAQKKRLSSAHTSPIWTGDNVFFDWVDPSDLPRSVFDVTKRSMELMPELTFGGFDVITYQHSPRIGVPVPVHTGTYVVEVNSAPMQTPETARKYADFFKEYVVQSIPPVVPVNIVMAVEEDPTETADYQRGYSDCRVEMQEMMQRMFQVN